MSLIVLYVSTAVIFLAADAVMLRTFMKPLFVKHLGDQVLDSPRLGVAVVFYLFYVAGVLWFASWPALRDGTPVTALFNGAFLGAVAYGTYEFTSYAVMRDWSPQQVAADFTWGIVITGVSAWLGVVITQALT